jgi:hypothetical protein
MAKNRGAANLAGLASLAALGYIALKGKQSPAEVVNRDTVSPSDADLGDFNQPNYGAQGVDLAGTKSAATGASRSMKPASGDASSDVASDSGTPDRRGLSEAASMARNYKPRRDDPGTLDLRGTSEAQRMDKYYRPRRGRAPEVTSEEIEQAKKTAGQPFFSEKGLTPMAPYVMAPAKRYKQGGAVKAKKMASGGMTTSSASKRADGIAQKGKTRGKMY